MNEYLSLLPRQGDTSERRKNGGNSGKEEHVICVIIILQKDDMLNGDGLRVVLWVSVCITLQGMP